jgi:amino acid adenylation domain-containing protein
MIAISDAERRNLLFERNQTQAEYPCDASFHSLFEAQVERSPDSLAVESAGSWLSYRELNVRSNQFAHRLRSLGVGPESLVGIFVDPSIDTLVGVLAILKAGGAYVPLDPAYPKERIAFMREDAALKVVLTQEHLVQELPPGIEHVVCLDVVASKPIEESAQNPVSGVSAENLAYIIYTSGSTGRPKGVMIHHRGLVNYLTWAVTAYDVASGSGALVHSSLSFDLTITGLFAPLLVGRGVTIVAAQHDISALSRTLRERKDASLVKITPAHLELLRRQLSADEMAGRTRAFVIGGEALLGESVAFWQEHSPDTVLVNEYGPTETVVGCCVYFVPRERRFAGAVPIGRPIANTQLYVLDADLQPVPAGETGELYIAGDGVARGYLNLPDATARSFVANPFYAPGAATSPRMYKTGDLVRYLPDGNLDFLGRADQQVKIRGFRIEVGEIEAVLASHRNVRGSVVLALPDALGERALTAYIEPVSPTASTAAELRQFLKERLPDYMVPARYVMLPVFPLTPNGKVDRAALPPPDAATSSASGVAFVAPRNEVERKLADIWEEVLPGVSVGLDDNFFDVGGHSLLAVHLVNEINRWFSAKLDVLTLYQEPTVRALARRLEGDGHVAVGAKLVQVRTGKGGSPIFFLNAGLEFFGATSRIERDEPIWISDVPWSTDLLQASARGETATFPTLAAMAAPHTELILQSRPPHSCILAGYSYGGPLAFEVAHQLLQAGTSVHAVLLFDSDIKISAPRRVAYWFRRQARKLREDALGHFMATVRRLRQPPKTIDHASAVLAMPPAGTHLSVENVPWAVIDRVWRHALRRYTPRTLPCRGVLFRAQECVYGEKRDYDGCLGWKGRFSRGLEVVEVSGDHWSMWKEPHAESLRKAWEAVLNGHRHPSGSPA